MSEPVCAICAGTGSVEGRTCPGCNGLGVETGFFSSTKAYVKEMFAKIESLEANLAIANSKLDDIMVKLDV